MAVPDVTVEAAKASAVKMPADAPPFILGSSSVSRKAILAATGASFETASPDIDEKAIGDRAGGNAEVLVRLIAEAKADALLARFGGKVAGDPRVLLTGDQVVCHRGMIREKPENEAQAREFIASYADAPCSTVGAICLHDLKTGVRVVGVHEAQIHFAPAISEAACVDALAKDPQVLMCAGALMVEHPLMAKHLERIEGGLDSVMGLCSGKVVELLGTLRETAASCATYGDVLGRPDLKNWAVVGDVTNPSKPASSVVTRLEDAGRRVFKVSPYDSTGVCFKRLSDVTERIDAVNLIISPKIGSEVLADMKKMGVRYVFMQPGADASNIVELAGTLGLTKQQGCVLVSDIPPLTES